MNDAPTAPAAEPTPPPRLLTSREAAAVLSICEKSLWQLRRDGLLRAVLLGRAVRFDPADLAALIERQKSKGHE